MKDRQPPLPAPADVAERILALLGLARRAGKLAVGATAVERLVVAGARPVVIIARDASANQSRRWARLRPVRGFVRDRVERDALAQRLGRGDLAVVAVADRGFVHGLVELGVVAEPSEDSAASR